MNNYKISKISANQIIPENIFLHNIEEKNIVSSEINPTDICNFSCEWCFTSKNRSNYNLDLSFLKNYIDSFIKKQGKSINFSGGGEPLLFKELYEKSSIFNNQTIIDYCLSANLSLGIITNGTLLPKLIKNIDINKLAFIRISLDSVFPEKYAEIHKSKTNQLSLIFESIKKLIEIREKYTPAIGISFIVDKASNLNYEKNEIEAISKIAIELNIDFVQFKHLHTKDEIKAEQEMKDIHDKCCNYNWKGVEFWVHHYISPKIKNTCSIVKYIEVLGANQIISPCCHLFGIDKTVNYKCNSSVCRYVSINKLLSNRKKTKNFNLSKQKLEKSINTFGFHPYRLFPSAPNLFYPFTN